MTKKIIKILTVFIAFLVLAFTNNVDQNKETEKKNAKADTTQSDLQKQVASLFKIHCATGGCHKGKYPKKKLNLEEENFVKAVVDVPSLQVPDLKLVDTKDPEKSYLLMKIRGDKGIVDERMPDEAPPLEKKDEDIIKDWIYSLKETETGEKKKRQLKSENRSNSFYRPAFWGTQLVNLPTTKMVGNNNLLFRISHRFYPAVNSGYESYFGLNGPADVLLSFDYGLTDKLNISIGHNTHNHEYELSSKYLLFDQKNFPVLCAILISGSLITEKNTDEKIFVSENMKLNIQASIARQISNKLSVMLLPAFSTNTNHWEESSEQTFVLGTGGRYMILDDFSIIGEWLPVIDGYKSFANGWGCGLEYKMGGHVFQAFLTNSLGLTSDQFITGGDLKIEDNEYRIGFNIYRSFWF